MTFLDPTARSAGRLFRPAALGVNRADAWALLKLAAPVTGLSLVNMAMSVTDTLMSASLGREALAAAAVGSDFYSILFYFAFGCLGGLGPLYAAAHAAGETSRLARLRSAGWLAALFLAVPLVAAIWFAPTILLLIGLDPDLVAQGKWYTRALALTLVPMLAVGVLRIRLTATERPGVMLRITLAIVPLNAAFNYGLMFGGFGIPALGVTGAGISTLLVACLTLAALLIIGRRHEDKGLSPTGWSEIFEIFRIGFPAAVSMLAEVGIYLGATIYAAALSVTDAAMHSIAIRLAGVTFAVYIGLQQAAMVRLARAGDAPARRQEVMATSLAMGTFGGVSLFLIVVGIAYPLTSFVFGVSTDAARIAMLLLLLLAVSDLVGPNGAVAGGLLRVLKDTKPLMIFSLIGHWVLAVPVGLFLTMVLGMGALGIWIALTAGSVLTSVLTVMVLRKHRPGRMREGVTARDPI